MILSDREILAALARQAMFLTPCPPGGSLDWTSTALDLTLDAEIRPWDAEQLPENMLVDPCAADFSTNELIRRYTQPHDCTNGFAIPPKMLVLGWTAEKLKLPHTSKIAARVEGKSSLARLGLGIHVTAPTIHAGFGFDGRNPAYEGSPIRLEIWNFGPLHIKLTKGMPICQLIFEEVHGTPEKGYAGQFRLQGPVAPRPRPARRK
jgi:dCTP deaminase